jgi:predicted RecB family nuclease
MVISAPIFEAYLKCPSKCWFLFLGKKGAPNIYSDFFRTQNNAYRAAGIKRLMAKNQPNECIVRQSPVLGDIKTATWLFAVDFSANNGNLESRLHAVERVPSDGRGKPVQVIPVRFNFTNKLTKDDKLMMAFDALLLSEMSRIEVSYGKIIYGNRCTALKIKTSALMSEVSKLTGKIMKLITAESPPDLILNRHCAECEYQIQCRLQATEKDDLSLLVGMAEKERKKLNSKGIFTVTQFSYTFRPRRRPKLLRDKREKYHQSLKALAIREKKIHIVGNSELKIEGTPVYLDVEGLPDRDFYYLIGLRLNTPHGPVQRNLWADSSGGEKTIWTDFLGVLSEIESPVLVHYGSYETVFLKRMRKRYGDLSKSSLLDNVINSAVNLLSFVFARIYFPTYSNGLKDIAKFLGFHWSESDASGAMSIVWRLSWEESEDPTFRRRLITYNCEDCEALELIATAVAKLSYTDNGVVAVESLKSLQTMWPKFSSPFSEFEQINRAARWVYQRDRVYVRTSKHIKRIFAKKQKQKKYRRPPAKVIFMPVRTACPTCNREGQWSFRTTKLLHDLYFGRFSLRSRFVKYHYSVFWCSTCQTSFGVPKEFWPGSKYGRNLIAYVVYHAIKLYIPRAIIGRSLNRLLGTELTPNIIYNLKKHAAIYYQEAHQIILDRLIKGSFVHVDETRANIRGKTAYVWVLTNLHEVSYLYSDTREGGFIQELLKEFKGILISDFYAAYDSLDCPQQKCLIHLMRDLNAEVLNLPYDEELKRIVRSFAELLQPIVETVDQFGLKKRYLRKHLVFIERFYDRLRKMSIQSEAAIKCRQRFEKNRDRLFKFLEYDGVPWNNNNAEHAIKAFARLREVLRGSCTASAIQEYLVLLSICQTCAYQAIDFLDFLRSGEKNIHVFAERKALPGKIPSSTSDTIGSSG